MEKDLSLEEFSAVRRRRTQQANQQQQMASSTSSSGSTGVGSSSNNPLYKLGRLAESQESQTLIVLLIFLDLTSGFYQLYFQARGWEKTGFIRVLEYQSAVCLLLFLLELFVLLVAFKASLFSHLGYCLDVILVSFMLYATVTQSDPAASPTVDTGGYDNSGNMVPMTRVLNVFRLWRLVRMVNTVLESSSSAHEETKRELDLAKEKIEGLKLRVKKADMAQKREVDKYRRLEQTFRVQKEELETMREALQIAAQTMAKVQGLETIAQLMGEEEKVEFDRVVQEQQELEREQGDTDYDEPISDEEQNASPTQPEKAAAMRRSRVQDSISEEKELDGPETAQVM